uniref:Kinesin motor domain-containing protein n=1 Tax=Chromera velia CCMP2878 TaxID=1169474 RepID=A0A0G4HZ66_9ALVE|eukprot:Cvel_9661.t1-p1 / transcript=Cvel_9661.t1 / gene=Cvel_9661 / organism=Chromera_velia_CCMP2878 / gene_product=Kinesin-like protein KIF13B, putative / transcript_product=Kinesin-like protein KIF13B, putative / location=Cvel_scaffold562:63497-79699(+) / protein_length=863 / sequence_SO=supercontig / SO=protein_coding / is_pseudo=false
MEGGRNGGRSGEESTSQVVDTARQGAGKRIHSLDEKVNDPGVLPRFFDDLAAFRLEAEERRNIAVPKGSSRSVSFEKGLSSEAEGGGAGEGVGAAGEEDSQTTGQEGEGSQQLEGEPEEDGAAVQEASRKEGGKESAFGFLGQLRGTSVALSLLFVQFMNSQVRVTLSFLELYNERIHDLLSLSSGTSPGSAAPSPGPTTSSAIDRESGLAFFAPQVERFSPGTVSSAPLSPGDAARRASRAQTSEGGGLGGLGASGLSASRAQLAEGPLEIFQHPQHGVFIPNLSQAVVKSRHDMQKLLIYAMQKRSMGDLRLRTSSTQISGRSVNFVDLAGSERHEKAHAERDGLWHGGGSPAPPLAHLHGGASRIGTGTGQEMWQQRTASLTGDGRHQRQREGAFINTSLSVLGVVISRLAEGQMKGDKTPSAGQAGGSGAPGTLARSFKRSATAGVAQKSTAKTLNRSGTRVGGPGDALGGKSLQQRQDHIPFRSSKLTFLLKDSLSGNSKTSMLATISPAESQLSETVSTLRFAQSVKSIRTNARVNVDRTGDLVKTLKGELQQLKSQLNKLSITSTASAFESARVRGLLSEVEEKERLSRELAKQWEDKVKESEDMQEKRKKAIESMGLATGDVTSLLQIGEDTPYLLNISDDPMLTGCVMYFLRRDEETLVGKAEEANVRLPGSGIEDTHCILENSEDSELKVRLASPSARVLVNGSRLDDERPLRHHDRLVIGRTFAFRVVVPKTVRSAAAVAAAAGRGKGFDIPTPRGLMDVSVRSGRDRSASSRSRLDSDVVAETSSETGGENGDKPARASNGSSAGGVGGVSLGAFPAGMDETEAMWIENEAALREFEDEDVRRFFQELQVG